MKTSLYLECVLTEEEIADRQHQLMEETINQGKLETELVGKVAHWATEKKDIEGKIRTHAASCRNLAAAIKTQREMRNVDCVFEIHPPHHLTIRTDTGEVVRTRALEEHERQMMLPGAEAEPPIRCTCKGGPTAEVKAIDCPIHGTNPVPTKVDAAEPQADPGKEITIGEPVEPPAKTSTEQPIDIVAEIAARRAARKA